MNKETFSKRILGVAVLLLLGIVCVVMAGLPRARADYVEDGGSDYVAPLTDTPDYGTTDFYSAPVSSDTGMSCTDCGGTCSTCSSSYPYLYPTYYGSSAGSYSYTTTSYIPTVSIPVPALIVSCVPSSQTVTVGQPMTWVANVSGGTGSYSYSWTGSDGLYGNAGSVAAVYNAPGTNTASITVTSGPRSKTTICPFIQVVPVRYPQLSASCSVDQSSLKVGDTATWTTNVSGGDGQYSYAWSGADGLAGSGPTVSKLYSSAGSKTGQLTVTSGDGQVENVSCGNVFVSNIQLDVSCSVSPSQVSSGGSATWSARAAGGGGSYTYAWSGSDGLSGSGPSLSKSYSFGGTKNGRVTVASADGQSGSADCGTVDVAQPLQPLSVSCAVSPNGPVQPNQTVTWIANASGGDGSSSYSYSWSGSDNLYGSGSSIMAYYATPGTQAAQVVVTSAGQSAQASCPSLLVQQNQASVGPISCFATPSTVAVDQTMTWQVNAPGNLQYSWTGSDNLYGTGPTIGAYYNAPGTQYASVTAIDPQSGQRQTAQCNLLVQAVAAYTGGVTVQASYSNPVPNGAISAKSVLLSQVPYTGLTDYWKPILFILVLLLVCGFVAYKFAFSKADY